MQQNQKKIDLCKAEVENAYSRLYQPGPATNKDKKDTSPTSEKVNALREEIEKHETAWTRSE